MRISFFYKTMWYVIVFGVMLLYYSTTPSLPYRDEDAPPPPPPVLIQDFLPKPINYSDYKGHVILGRDDITVIMEDVTVSGITIAGSNNCWIGVGDCVVSGNVVPGNVVSDKNLEAQLEAKIGELTPENTSDFRIIGATDEEAKSIFDSLGLKLH